jgi:hypothetical protein
LGSKGLNMVKDFPSIYAKIKKFNPIVRELKVFNGSNEIKDESEILNKKILDIKNLPSFLSNEK